MRQKKYIAGLVSLLIVAGCSEANRNPSPVELVADTTQTQLVIDLASTTQSNSLGTLSLRAIQKNTSTTTPTDPTNLDVVLQSYRVQYRRTDGGRLVPAPIVRSTSGVIAVGGTAQTLNNFVILTNEAVNEAPFAALKAQNGGVDPETGQRIVKLDAIIDVFGETLSGQKVSARATIPLWVCSGCTATS